MLMHRKCRGSPILAVVGLPVTAMPVRPALLRRGTTMRSLTWRQFAAARQGVELGALCLSFLVAGVAHLRNLLSVPGHPLQALLAMVMFTRPTKNRGPGGWVDVLRMIASPSPLPRWVSQLLKNTYATYLALRHAAAPRRPLPRMQTQAGVALPRAVRRVLRSSGIQADTDDPATIHQRASQVLVTLWRSLAERHAVLWFDNFFKPRYFVNPALVQGSLNCTVMAVLHTCSLNGYRGLPALGELVGRARAAADGVWQRQAVLVAAVERIRSVPLNAMAFRIPLDVVRRHVRSLQWRPLSLNDDQVGSQAQLCRTLRTCRWTMEQTGVRRPMPLLCDENICYRVWKICYSELTQLYDVPRFLRDMPLLYGIWHPYKHVLELLHRKFLPLLMYLQRGAMSEGTTVPSRVTFCLRHVMQYPWCRAFSLNCQVGGMRKISHTPPYPWPHGALHVNICEQYMSRSQYVMTKKINVVVPFNIVEGAQLIQLYMFR